MHAPRLQHLHLSLFCDPKAPTCDSGQTCKPSTVLAGYYVCN
ncbi:MAG TPA: hypothetical protein VLM85_23545 [Polyangiaceae bacterium]|nr:hypothetical protein [Polyangiaceae bacterium]